MKVAPSAQDLAIEAKRKASADASATLDSLNAQIQTAKDALASINANIATAQLSFENQSADSQNKLKDLLAQRDSVLAEINSLSDKKTSLLSTISSLEKEILELTNEKSDLNDAIAGLSVQKTQLTNDNKVKQDILDDLNAKIAEAAAGLSDAVTKKAKADADYLASAARLIAAADRDAALDQREAYIKAKFDSAGLPYEPTK